MSPEHLIRLPFGKWSLWPRLCVRGAGFPVAMLEELSSPVCTRMAARVLGARAAREPATSLLEALKDTFATETQRVRAALRRVAADSAFREAVVWQNRGAFRRAVAPLAAAPLTAGGSVTRRQELLVAGYLQRYCVKNESIGFFGPVGWARFGETPAIAATSGPTLLESRNVYFESWCIDTIAHVLDRDPDLRPWRVPYLPSFVRLDAGRLMIGSRVVRQLSAEECRLVEACDGERHAQAIARGLRSAPDSTFVSDAAIYAQLEEWERAGHVIWTFEGPRALRPERTLRDRLDRIDDPGLRARATAVLDEIEGAAREIRSAVGNPDALDRAIESLESTFTRFTGAPPTRRDGEIYAGRTLIYEDCRRDLSLELGPDIVRSLGPPLSLMLRSVHWAMHELVRGHRAEFHRIFDDLARRRGGPVSLGLFVSRTSLFRTAPGSLSPVGAQVRSALQQRWAAVLKPPETTRRVDYRCRVLRPAVQEAFACPDDVPSAWARAVSPDVMIDGSSIDAIRRGEYQLVLGEMHLINSLQFSLFVDQHPPPAEIIRLLDLDFADPLVVWIEPKEKTPHRTHLALRPTDFAYISTRDPAPLPSERTLRIADLEVVDDGGMLVVQTRDGRLRFPSLEFFGGLMMRTELGAFSVLPPLPHQPRITIDNVVVCREQWRMPASDLTFATCGDGVDRFVACHRWVQQHELPQRVFVKMPTEHKPTYVDFSSPVYVEAFARATKKVQRTEPAGVITITEMLPTPSGTWLTDAAGRSYTCELRLVAVHHGAIPAPPRSPLDRARPLALTIAR